MLMIGESLHGFGEEDGGWDIPRLSSGKGNRSSLLI